MFIKTCLPVFFIGLLTCCSGNKSRGGKGETPSTAITISKDQIQDSLIYPEYRGWVSDFEDLLTEDQERTLSQVIDSFERATSIEIAIVSLDSTWTTDGMFESYILELANRWGVGKNEKNNGIVMGLSGQFRRVRIEVGMGLEEALSNNEAKEIIDRYMIPAFRTGAYYNGLREGLNRVMMEVK